MTAGGEAGPIGSDDNVARHILRKPLLYVAAVSMAMAAFGAWHFGRAASPLEPAEILHRTAAHYRTLDSYEFEGLFVGRTAPHLGEQYLVSVAAAPHPPPTADGTRVIVPEASWETGHQYLRLDGTLSRYPAREFSDAITGTPVRRAFARRGFYDRIDLGVQTATRLDVQTLVVDGHPTPCQVIQVNYASSRERAQVGLVEFCIDLRRLLVLQERFNEPPRRWTFTVSSLSLNERPPAWAIERADHSVYTRLEWSGGPAPAFIVADLDNRPVRLSDLRGQVVVLVFWRASCRPCVEQLRAIDDFRRAPGTEAPVVISVTDDPPEVAREWLMRHELVGGRVVMDRGGHIRADYRCDELPPHSSIAVAKSGDLPVVVVIDRRGDVAHYSMGFASAKMLKTVLEQSLSAK